MTRVTAGGRRPRLVVSWRARAIVLHGGGATAGGVVDRNSRVVAPRVSGRGAREISLDLNSPSAGMYRCPACPGCPGSFSQTYHYLDSQKNHSTASSNLTIATIHRRSGPGSLKFPVSDGGTINEVVALLARGVRVMHLYRLPSTSSCSNIAS